MKKLKQIIKWTGIILLIFVSAVATITASKQHQTYDAPYPAIVVNNDSAVIAKGKHIVFDIAHCGDCHSNNNIDSFLRIGEEPPLSGGHVFELPVGKIYAKNITPDKETGIGHFSDAEIARSLRYGVHPDGTAIFDFMPFHNMSDEDLSAVISYLRAQRPVSNTVPVHQLNVLGNVVKAFMVKPVGPTGSVPVHVEPDTTADYGRYLVISLANCGGCHTKRDMSGAYIGELLGGGNPMETPFGPLTPPNLTPDKSGRIYGWTVDNFITRMRSGKLIEHSPMPWNSYKRMSDDELKAIYYYLQTVTPASSPTKNKRSF